MTTALEKRPGREIVVGNLSRDQVALIKRTIAQGFTNDELQLFLFQAERKGLDPLSREIYAFKGSDGRIQIITGIDGFRSRADATGDYLPGRPPTFEVVDDKLVSATAYVKRWDAKTGQWHEVAATAWLEEQERSAPVWKKMPRVMLAKCAEAIAFRRAFPSQLGGLYTAEEIPRPQTVPIEPMERLDPVVTDRDLGAALRTPAARPAPATPPSAASPPPPEEEPPLVAQEATETNGEPAGAPNSPGVDDDPTPGRKRATCKQCGALKYGVSGGQCPGCRDEAAKPPAKGADRGYCNKCDSEVWAVSLDRSGLCGECSIVERAREHEPSKEPPGGYPDNMRTIANPGPNGELGHQPPSRPSTATTRINPDEAAAARNRWVARLRELSGAGYFTAGEGSSVVKAAQLVADAESWTEAAADKAIQLLEDLADRNGRKARG